MKTSRKKPALVSISVESLKENIVVSACSKYDDDDCFPAGYHLDSIPGKPPIMM